MVNCQINMDVKHYMVAEEIPKVYDAKKSEEKWSKFWYDHEIYKLENCNEGPIFHIDTPPPYPSGDLHMGNFLNWTYFDIIARFKRMKGYRVLMPQGWDEHGLPTEVKVEQHHNVRRSEVDHNQFIKWCKDYTEKFIKKMRSQFIRNGFSLDWTREYRTSSDEYVAKVQRSFIELYKKGLIYRAQHPINWCPRCETAISDAEVEYTKRKTKFNHVKFKLDDKNIIIATTRPELLPSCVAVAVNPKDLRNSDLIDLDLEVPLFGKKVPVIADRAVDASFGTGIVMICTFGDKQDVEWAMKHDLDIVECFDEKGRMTKVAQKYEGMSLAECKEKIIEDLKSNDLLVKQDDLDQNVGICWRCSEPIEILERLQWFVKVRDYKDRLLDENEKIKWYPNYMRQRMIDWTNSLSWDWVISRQRVFGTPFPVWYCSRCGEIILPSIEQLPVDPIKEKMKCRKCGSENTKPEKAGMDTWMDSSITIAHHAGWPDNPNWKEAVPAQLQPNGTDIIRTWDYYLMVRHLMLFDRSAFKSVLINGMVMGEDGRKMSKSLGNFVTTQDALDKYCSDALRQWVACGGSTGSDIPFSWKEVKHGFKFLIKYWNALRFVFMNIKDTEFSESIDLKPIDKWILNKLYQVINLAGNYLEYCNFNEALKTIRAFIWHNFCDDYIECVKYRLYSNMESKEASQFVLYKVVKITLKLLAPFVPFFTEEAYNSFINKDYKSIHLESWPKGQKIDKNIIEEGNLAQNIISSIRKYKSDNSIPLNREITQINIYSDKKHTEVLKKFKEDIKNTSNAKALEILEGRGDFEEKIVEIKPNYSKIGPKFRSKAKEVINYLQNLNLDEIDSIESGIEIEFSDGDKDTIAREDIILKKAFLEKSGQEVDIISDLDFAKIVISI